MIEAEEVPESFVGDIAAAAPDVVVLVDAVDLGAEPGAVALLEREQVATYAPTTHRLPLSLVMDVVQRRTGANVFLIAVQPLTLAFGAPVTPQVGAGIELLAGVLSELLRAPCGRQAAMAATPASGEAPA